MKTCLKCKQTKEFSEFNKHKQKSDGYYTYCKECKSKDDALHYQNNKEKRNLYKKEWENKNKDKVKLYKEKWDIKNPNYLNNYKKENPEKIASINAKRRASKKTSIPNWVDNDEKFLIEEAYSLAKLRTDLTGTSWHVDHIIPLTNNKVCGLHTIYNLQVIPAKINLQKGNKYEF